jgi:hypothetical protein
MTPRGGKREGAGAKKQAPADAKRRTLLLTDKELELVRQYIKLIREAKKNDNDKD